MTVAMVHDASAASLAGELAAAFLAALPAGLAVARLPSPWFLAPIVALAALFLPLLAVVLIASPVASAAALACLLLPVLAWGWRRCPRAELREARRLGAAAPLVLRALVVPAVAPPAALALAAGIGLLALRWSLDVHPAPILVPYPAVETG